MNLNQATSHALVPITYIEKMWILIWQNELAGALKHFNTG